MLNHFLWTLNNDDLISELNMATVDYKGVAVLQKVKWQPAYTFLQSNVDGALVVSAQ